MAGLKHFPDKPVERGPDDLEQLDNGNFICQQKCDGWRLEICKTLKGETVYLSRHNKSMSGDVEAPIKEQVEKFLSLLPNRSQLDGEWLSRRRSTNKKSEPRLVLFDVIRLGGSWELNTPYEDRWSSLQELWHQALDTFGEDAFPNISLSLTAEDSDFAAFYERQKSLPQSEGVVIKHKKSTLIGDRRESKENPRWVKIKYRSASDGEMTMEHLRQNQVRW